MQLKTIVAIGFIAVVVMQLVIAYDLMNIYDQLWFANAMTRTTHHVAPP